MLVAAAAWAACAPGAAATPQAWSGPLTIETQAPFASSPWLSEVSCPSDGFCVASISADDHVWTGDPTNPSTPGPKDQPATVSVMRSPAPRPHCARPSTCAAASSSRPTRGPARPPGPRPSCSPHRTAVSTASASRRRGPASPAPPRPSAPCWTSPATSGRPPILPGGRAPGPKASFLTSTPIPRWSRAWRSSRARPRRAASSSPRPRCRARPIPQRPLQRGRPLRCPRTRARPTPWKSRSRASMRLDPHGAAAGASLVLPGHAEQTHPELLADPLRSLVVQVVHRPDLR